MRSAEGSSAVPDHDAIEVGTEAMVEAQYCHQGEWSGFLETPD